jgi:hypothetical protein
MQALDAYDRPDGGVRGISEDEENSAVDFL